MKSIKFLIAGMLLAIIALFIQSDAETMATKAWGLIPLIAGILCIVLSIHMTIREMKEDGHEPLIMSAWRKWFNKHKGPILILIVTISLSSCSHPKPQFYDGEGNPIAENDVKLLVTSQFVRITDKERTHLDSVFYATKH